MADTKTLRAILSALKLGAKPKRWADRPVGPAICCGYVFTCCIENGRLVLAVSLMPGGGAIDAHDLYDVIVSVFGEAQMTSQATYPNRGATTIFSWPASCEGGVG